MMFGVVKGSKVAHRAVTKYAGWSESACHRVTFQNEPRRIVGGMEMPAEVYYTQPAGTRLCKRCYRGTGL